MSCRQPSTQPRKYLQGNAITVTVKLLDTDGLPVDPVHLRMLVAKPGDTASSAVTLTPRTDDPFIAEGTFTPDIPGDWKYRIETFSGPVDAAVERTVIVTPRSVPTL